MNIALTTLLSLGLSLGLGTVVFSETIRRPTLTVQPSSVATRGIQLTFLCEEVSGAQEYYLYKDGSVWFQQLSAESSLFLIETSDWIHAGKYQCSYKTHSNSSELSDPVEIVITGLRDKPSLLALPGFVVTLGDNVTLQCDTQKRFDKLILTEKDHSIFSSQNCKYVEKGKCQALFLVGPMDPRHSRTFRCYGYFNNNPQFWSEPSNALEIPISGQLPVIPFLLVKPRPMASSEESMTLLCQSQSQMDTFLLTKEGAAHPPLRARAVLRGGWYQAEFPMSAMTSTIHGTYRCYGSQDGSPFLLSQPSTPVELRASGGYLTVVIAVSLAFLILVLVLVFVFLLRFHLLRQNEQGKEGLTSAVSSPGDFSSHQQNPEDVQPQKMAYAQIDHSKKRHQQSSCHSWDQSVDMKAAASRANSMTYAHLNNSEQKQHQVTHPSS